jgi:thioredoxin-like negative regulator of GroEL
MNTARLLAAAVVVVAVALVALRYRGRGQRLSGRRGAEAAIEPALIAGAPRTWVVFTTPYCAACGPVLERITAVDADARLVVVDVGDRPDLARRHDVRTAPTVLLADERGVVQARFVGDIDESVLSAAAAP